MSFTHGRTTGLRFIITSALAAVVATVGLPALAQAQPPAGQGQGAGGGMGRGGGGGRMMSMLFDGINLTDVERKSIDSIRTSYQPQIAQARSSGDRSQARDLMRKQTDDFRNVLTPDQQSTFDKNVAAMRSRMQQGGMGGGAGTGGGNPQ